jgi:predicted TIM-barrel fold metal-dependent hydrolase
MRVIAIEEHWTTSGIDRALRAQPAGSRDESVVLNDRGDIPARLLDIGERRVEAMDAAGIDVQILSYGRSGAAAIADFLGALPNRADQRKIAHANAEALYGLEQATSGADAPAASQLQEQS